MNVTECHLVILEAAEALHKRTGFKNPQLSRALRIFRTRTYRMRDRLNSTRARLTGVPVRPKCLE